MFGTKKPYKAIRSGCCTIFMGEKTINHIFPWLPLWTRVMIEVFLVWIMWIATWGIIICWVSPSYGLRRSSRGRVLWSWDTFATLCYLAREESQNIWEQEVRKLMFPHDVLDGGHQGILWCPLYNYFFGLKIGILTLTFLLSLKNSCTFSSPLSIFSSFFVYSFFIYVILFCFL